jgi:proline-specific peptidase
VSQPLIQLFLDSYIILAFKMSTITSDTLLSNGAAPPSPHITEGRIPFSVSGEIYETYYKLAGNLEGRTKRPLIVLHGGPGFSHDYMIPLVDLAAMDRPVIFYDQIGSGRSTVLQDKPKEFWTFDLFIDEFLNLASHFGVVNDFDLIGHSWGGVLLSEAVLRRQPAGLKHCIFSNSICRMKDYGMSHMQQAKALPEWILETLAKGYQDTPECRSAALAFSKVHQCRLDPQPSELGISVDYGFKNARIIQCMSVLTSSQLRKYLITLFSRGANGLNAYDCVDRLHEIKVPCLIINGKYDVAADFTIMPYFKNLPKVKWVKFESEHSSDTPMWEDRERYMKLLDEFLE